MPRAPKDFGPLDPAETAVFTFDFAKFLGIGETVSAIVWSLVALNGVDLTPSIRLIGASSVLGTAGLQRIGNGIANENYQVTATLTTSIPQIIPVWANCPCQPRKS